MKLNLSNNNKNESQNVQTAQVINPINTVVAPAIEDADAVEIKDEPKAEKKPVTLKRKITTKKSDTKVAAQYAIQEYTTKKGKTAYLLFGFDSKESAEKIAEKCSKTISASWRTGEDGSKRYCLSMGTRYGDVARTLCAALNAGDKKAVSGACAASRDIYDMAVAAGKAEREAKKAEREAKAKAEEKEEPAPDKPAKAGYTSEQVAAMLRDVLSGKELPKDVAVLMKAA